MNVDEDYIEPREDDQTGDFLKIAAEYYHAALKKLSLEENHVWSHDVFSYFILS